jgi:hypothetical protein
MSKREAEGTHIEARGNGGSLAPGEGNWLRKKEEKPGAGSRKKGEGGIADLQRDGLVYSFTRQRFIHRGDQPFNSSLRPF